MRWQTNFYDFRFKWTATAAIGIHLTKAWLSQLVNLKMQSDTLEERYAIEVLREFRKRFFGKRPALFKSAQWHFYQDNAPVHNSILVTGYLTKMGIKTVPQPPYSPDLAPCDCWLFPKLRSCRYETIEERKEAVMRSLTHSHKRTSMGPSRRCWNGTTSGLQLEEITSKGTRVSCMYYQ